MSWVGNVICPHIGAIPSFDYRVLWGERALQTHMQIFALQDANAAVQALTPER